ncbi:hypothetical protein BGZ99_002703, partial [Dissophora globulifera]
LADRTIGRIGSTVNVPVDEDDVDDGHDTFPDDADISSDAAAVNLHSPLSVSAEEDLVTEENSMDGNEPEVRPRKRGSEKITYTKSSRKARDADVPLNENAVPRKINPTNLMAEVVAALHPMRAMRPGRLESCLFHSLKELFPCMDDQDRSLLSGHLLETMQTMARVHTDLLREGLLVTELYVARTFRTYPAIGGDRGRVHGDKRKERFNFILLKGKRDSFFQRLVNRLIRWDSDDSDLKKSSSPPLVASDDIFNEYLQITSQRQAPPFRLKDRDACDSTFMNQCAETLSDMVGSHLYKFSLELKKRALVHNPSWASSENGKAMLDSIDDTTGRSQQHDCVSIHLILNLNLPAKAQIQVLPQIGYEDAFCSFTECQLVRCLLKDFRMDNKNNRLTPIAKKMCRLSSAEQEKKSSIAKVLKDVFGSKVSAEKNTQDEVGRLSFLLFLSGKNTSYRRGANMLWAKDDGDPASTSSSSSFNPLSALQQKYLKAKVIFKSDDVSAIKQARTALEEMKADDPRYASSKLKFKDLIRQSLQHPEKYQEQIGRAASGQPRQ